MRFLAGLVFVALAVCSGPFCMADDKESKPKKGSTKKRVIELPKNVQGWVSGDVKNLKDIEFEIPDGKGTDGKGTDGKGTDGKGTDGKGTGDDRHSAEELSLSPEAIALLKSVEVLRLLPYDDKAPKKELKEWVKGATIGYGHLISKDTWSTYKDGISQEDAEILFLEDLEPFEETVRSSITAKLTQNEYDALVILAFNIGSSAFSGSSVAKLVNDPKAKTDFANLEAAWKAWNKIDGKFSKGLANRRQCEWQIYTSAIYKRW